MSLVLVRCMRFFGLMLLFGWHVDCHAQIRQAEYHIANEQELARKRSDIDTAIKKVYLDRKRDPDKAIARLREITGESEAIGYDYGTARAQVCIANIVINLKGEEDATPALQALRAARKYLYNAGKKDARLTELWYINMGAAFAKISEMDSAMYYYSSALDIALKRKSDEKADKVALALNYISLEAIFLEMEQFDKVIYYAHQSARLSQDNNLNQQLYRSYMQLAAAFIESGAIDSALHYMLLLEEVDYQPEEFDQKIFNGYMGDIYLMKNMPQDAIRYFRKSIAVNDHPSPRSYKGLGIAYKAVKQYDKAEQYLLAAETQLLQVKNSRKSLIVVYNHLASLYDSLKNYRAAYTYRSRSVSLQKEVDNAQKIQVINRLEGAFRKVEQDKQLAESKVQMMSANSRLSRRKAWTAGIAMLVILLLAFIINLYQKQKLQRQKNKTLEQRREIDKLKAAIDAEERERSRIGRELHDDIMVQLSIIKMNLEGLPAQVPAVEQSNDFVSIREQLNIAGRDLRQTAHNLSPDTLLADGLTQALVYFFKNVQYRTKLDINFQYYGTAPQLPQETEINLYRIAQELIQNIIKHAKATNVLVQLSYRPDIITLTVEDDGKGFDMNGSPDKMGIGLKSIRSRLKVMNGDMDIHSRHPQGTSVTIEVYI